jgi:hypothetical protein
MSISVSFVHTSPLVESNDDKHGECSAHHEEYCDNILQKFEPLMQIGPQIYCCYFSTHTLEICFIFRRWWATNERIVVNIVVSCCNTVNVSSGDSTQSLIFVRCSITGIFNCDATSRTIRKKEKNNYSYAFRCYETAKQFLWRHEWCQIMRQKFPSCCNSCKLCQRNPGTFWIYYV